MKLVRRIAGVLIALVVVVYLIALGVLYFKQRDFQYDPNHPAVALADTKLGKDTQVVTIPTTDNATVTGWYVPPPAGKPVILYLKGYWGSFTSEHERLEAFAQDGYGFLSIDYRGYALSPAPEVTQQHILDDSLAAYDWLKAKGAPVLIWGRSLGTGPATYVASKRDPEALLLETPFLSAVDVAFDRYPMMPVYQLMQDQFPVKDWIKDVKAPIFVAHGTNDHTIDVHHGRGVYALAPHKYGLWIVDGADHGDLWARGIWGKAKTFFTDVANGVGTDAAASAPAPAMAAPTKS